MSLCNSHVEEYLSSNASAFSYDVLTEEWERSMVHDNMHHTLRLRELGELGEDEYCLSDPSYKSPFYY